MQNLPEQFPNVKKDTSGMDYFPGNDGKRRMISPRQCFRCGHNHVFGQCRALHAKCFLCFQTGHYRKVCRNKAQQLKCTKTKGRDSERMTAFIRKKTAESLPFCFTSNEELVTCFSKHQGVHENYHNQLRNVHVLAGDIQSKLRSKQENLEQQLWELQESASRDKAEFISKQKIMDKKLEEAKNLELNLRRRRDTLQEQLYLGEHKLGKVEDKLTTTKHRNSDLERENLQLQKRIAALEIETEHLRTEVKESQRAINIKISELHEMTKQRNAVFQYFHENDKYVACKSKEQALRNEFLWLLDNVGYARNVHGRSGYHYECDKCGSSKVHSNAHCLAMGTSCGLCHKANHFSTKCRSALRRQNSTPSWLLDLLSELAETVSSK